MKTIAGDFLTDLQGTMPNAAFLCKITRRDETVIALTDHDVAIEFDSVSYEPSGEDVVSVIRATATTDTDNADIQSAYRTGGITRRDVLARLYDGATVQTWMVNYDDVSKYMRLPTGIVGRATVKDQVATLEILGLKQLLSARIGEIVTPGCRAELGGSRCGVDLNFFTEHGVVLAVTGRYRFAAEIVERHTAVDHEASWAATDSTWFTKGWVIWDEDISETFVNPTTGDQENDGLEMEIQKYEYDAWSPLGTVPIFNLSQSMPFDISVGDKFRVIAGCLKSRDVCVAKFNNLDNFRGEPDVPGPDKAQQYVEPL